MFSHIIFLILVLLLVSFSPMESGGWVEGPWTAFCVGMLAYVLLLILIGVQTTFCKKFVRTRKQTLLTVTNLELLGFLALYHFVLGGHRIFPNAFGLIALCSLALYLFALYFFHWTAYPHLANGARGTTVSGPEYAAMQLRLIIPFTLPFLLFSLLTDIAAFFPNSTLSKVLTQESSSLSEMMVLLCVIAGFLALMMLFFPPLIQRIWQCRPIADKKLKAKLEAVCSRAKFRHAGMKTWTIMNHSYTAGIIGILPRFRYVMFTRRLLDELSDDAIEAVLAHEIGHSDHKHLLIYPLILLGMVIATAVFTFLFSDPIAEYYRWQAIHRPSPLWSILYPLSLFIPYAIIVVVYFRYVFGYFSRLFERQADLHVFALGIPPEHMLRALDELGRLTGNSHHHPSWHHYSIHERMRFLQKAAQDREIIAAHHRRVKRNLILYCLILAAVSLMILSPLMPL